MTKPILRVIDLVGDGRSMTLPIHPKVIARTHCVRFMDTYNGAEASIFMAADGWLMMRRVGNVWAWPPSDDVQAGAMLYAIGELVECNDKGEPVAWVTISNRITRATFYERDFTIPPSDASPESVAAFERRRTAYRCAELVYAAIGVDVDRPAWDHLGSERRAVMAAVIDEEITAHIEAELARRQASAPGVEDALADLLGQVGCAAHHRDAMAGALRAAITAHVVTEVDRRIAVAPGVEEALVTFGDAEVTHAHHLSSRSNTARVAAGDALRAAIAADRERAVAAARPVVMTSPRSGYYTYSVRVSITDGITVTRETDVSGLWSPELESCAGRMLLDLARPITDAERAAPPPAARTARPTPNVPDSVPLGPIVDALLWAVAQCHDGSDLWEHTKRDPDAFRRTVARVLSGKIRNSPTPDDARRLVEEYRVAVDALVAHCVKPYPSMTETFRLGELRDDARDALLRALGVEA